MVDAISTNDLLFSAVMLTKSVYIRIIFCIASNNGGFIIRDGSMKGLTEALALNPNHF